MDVDIDEENDMNLLMIDSILGNCLLKKKEPILILSQN